MVVDHVGSDNFDESVKGIRFGGIVRSEQALAVGAELHEGFLHQVVNQGGGDDAPAAPGDSGCDSRDQAMEMRDELLPRRSITGTGTSLNQFLQRHRARSGGGCRELPETRYRIASVPASRIAAAVFFPPALRIANSPLDHSQTGAKL